MDVAAIPRSEFVPPLRASGALPAAGLVTLALLFGMQQLIKQDYAEPEPDSTPRLIDVVMPDVEPIVNRFDPPKKIVEPQTPPPTTVDDPWTPPATEGGFSLAHHVDPVTTVKPNIGYGSGGLVKQVMLAPEYPRHALSRGIEGFVDIEYDVTAYGATSNLRVLHAEPEGVFERAALAAVAKWKFRPQVVDEQAVATYGLKERLRFSIEK